MKSKVMSLQEAMAPVRSGQTILIGGFLQGGSPEMLIGWLLDQGIGNLDIVSNDTGTADTRTIQLMRRGQIRHVVASYIGHNEMTGQMRMKDRNSVELVPQGTLAERLRAGGAGLGGILTPVGVGTEVAEGKQLLVIDGREYLLEAPIRGDVALVHAHTADHSGNLFMKGTSKNFNALMPAAADYVVVQAGHIVPTGGIDPELVTIPGILVDAVVPLGREEG